VTFMEDGDEFVVSFDKTATLYAADGFEEVSLKPRCALPRRTQHGLEQPHGNELGATCTASHRWGSGHTSGASWRWRAARCRTASGWWPRRTRRSLRGTPPLVRGRRRRRGGGGSLRTRTHRCVSHTSLMHIDVSYTRLMHIDVSFTRLMCRTRTPDDEAARVSGRANTASWVYRRRLTGRLWNTASCLTAAPLTREAAGVCGGGAGEAAFVLKAAHAARVRAVEVLPSADGRDNSHLFASASSDGVVRVWDSRMVSSSDTCAPAATMARPPSLCTGYTQGWHASR
jgi:hypothetical protein